MVQSPRLRETPGGAKCFWGAGEGGRSLTTVGVCVQQQDRAAGGRVPVPAGLTRTRLPLVSRRAAPRPPAARAAVVHGGVAQPDSASADRGFESHPCDCANVAQWRRHRFRTPAPQGRRGFESHRWLCDRSSRGEHEAVNLGTRVRFPPVTPSPSSGAAGSARGSGPRGRGFESRLLDFVWIAQPVERRPEEPRVPGSTPGPDIMRL